MKQEEDKEEVLQLPGVGQTQKNKYVNFCLAVHPGIGNDKKENKGFA